MITLPEPLPTFLLVDEVCALLRVSKRTLAVWRQNGTGPAWTKSGPTLRSAVIYPADELEAWLAGRAPRAGKGA